MNVPDIVQSIFEQLDDWGTYTNMLTSCLEYYECGRRPCVKRKVIKNLVNRECLIFLRGNVKCENVIWFFFSEEDGEIILGGVKLIGGMHVRMGWHDGIAIDQESIVCREVSFYRSRPQQVSELGYKKLRNQAIANFGSRLMNLSVLGQIKLPTEFPYEKWYGKLYSSFQFNLRNIIICHMFVPLWVGNRIELSLHGI